MNMLLNICALTLQAAALLLWFSIHKRIERWVWYMVLIGFCILVAHRLDEVLNYNFISKFQQVVAIAISIVAFISVVQTRHRIHKTEAFNRSMAEVHQKLEILRQEVENRDPIALRMAEILANFRTQLTYYEHMAATHSLPKYHKKPEQQG